MRDRLPHLKAIVQYKGKLSQAYENVYNVSWAQIIGRADINVLLIHSTQWEQFLELGKDMDDSVIEEKIKTQKPEQCAVMIYTVKCNTGEANIDLILC